jgi:hypothetical protein
VRAGNDRVVDVFNPEYRIPIAFLIGIAFWLIFLRDPPPMPEVCVRGPRTAHQLVPPSSGAALTVAGGLTGTCFAH